MRLVTTLVRVVAVLFAANYLWLAIQSAPHVVIHMPTDMWDATAGTRRVVALPNVWLVIRHLINAMAFAFVVRFAPVLTRRRA